MTEQFYSYSYAGVDCCESLTAGNIPLLGGIKAFVEKLTAYFLAGDISQPIDLKPICIDKVKAEDFILHAKTSILLTLNYDPASGYVSAQKKEIGINIYAKSRDDLIKEFKQHLIMLWHQYAKAPDNELTKGAMNLKLQLKLAFEETGRAA